MKKIILGGLLLLSGAIYSQDVENATVVNKTVETVYYRPSVVEVYVGDENEPLIKEVIGYMMDSIPMSKHFDDHNFGYNTYSGVPGRTVKTSPSSVAGLLSSTGLKKTEKTEEDLQRDEVFAEIANDLAKSTVEKWFNRDSRGNFDVSLITERGFYSATDDDAMKARASKVDRRDMIGIEYLIGKTYLVIYEVDGISKINPEDPKSEEYNASYTVRAYKLKWNEEVSNDFYENYWSDASNPNNDNINRWSDASFDYELVAEAVGEASTMDDVAGFISGLVKSAKGEAKTKDQALLELAKQIKTQALFKMEKRIDDLKPRTTVYSAYPVEAKLGTKEGLTLDDRYFVYEIELQEDGSQKKVRRGVVRVRNVVDNDKIADGDSDRSTFAQVGGKRISDGMLLEANKDWGIIGYAGYKYSPNKAVGGINVGIDYRVTTLFSKWLPISGLHLGAELTINPFSEAMYGRTKTSGMALVISGMLSKEFYFTRKGNLYVQPYLGLGYAGYSFNEFDGVKVDKNSTDKSWGTFAIPVSVGIGANVHPNVSVMLRPGFIKTFSYTDRNGNDVANDTNHKDGYGFDKLDGALNLEVSLDVKVRF